MKCVKALLCVCVLGCSNNNPTSDGGVDASMGQDAAQGMDAAQMQDVVTQDVAQDSGNVINGCTSFVDMTASGATITGPSTAAPSQYTPNCVHIKVGQMVTWNADFTSHPMSA